MKSPTEMLIEELDKPRTIRRMVEVEINREIKDIHVRREIDKKFTELISMVGRLKEPKQRYNKIKQLKKKLSSINRLNKSSKKITHNAST